jgi:acid phosphatase family membrane protein YuiD
MFFQILLNPIFQATIISLVVTQIIKFFVDFAKDGHFHWQSIFRGGGMPSSHTSTVVALMLSVYFTEQLTTLFIVTLIFAGITVRDVIGDKVFALHQQTSINKIIEQLRGNQKVEWEHLIGHTFLEVIAGTLVGVIVTLIVFFLR